MYTFFPSGQKKTFLSELTSSLAPLLLTLENLPFLDEFVSSVMFSLLTLENLLFLKGDRSDWDVISGNGGEVITASFCLNDMNETLKIFCLQKNSFLTLTLTTAHKYLMLLSSCRSRKIPTDRLLSFFRSFIHAGLADVCSSFE